HALPPGRERSLEHVAHQLGTSPRSLRRHLRGEGTSFRDVLDHVLASEAARGLEVPDCDLRAVAERLGYTDLVSFRRAFQRWYGLTPTAYRKGLFGTPVEA